MLPSGWKALQPDEPQHVLQQVVPLVDVHM
jgi:hypothetical protein